MLPYVMTLSSLFRSKQDLWVQPASPLGDSSAPHSSPTVTPPHIPIYKAELGPICAEEHWGQRLLASLSARCH